MAKAKGNKKNKLVELVGVAPVIQMLDPKSIKMNLDENRTNGMDADSIAKFAAQIRREGLLQPVMVHKKGEEFHMVYGHRRTLACAQIEGMLIPAIVREEMSDKSVFLARNWENGQRENESPIDRARQIVLAKNKFGMTQNEIAEEMDVYPADISRIVSLLKLPESLQATLHNGHMTMQSALALVPADKEEQKEVSAKIDEVVAEMSAAGASDTEIKRATTDLVDQQTEKEGTTTKPPRKKNPKTPSAPKKGNLNDVVPPSGPSAPLNFQTAPAPTNDKPASSQAVKSLKKYEELLDLIGELEDAVTNKECRELIGQIIDFIDGNIPMTDVIEYARVL